MSPFWTIKLRSRSTVWVTSKRLISTGGGRHKAVKNWTRPSIAEMGIPKEPWQQVHNKNQKKYNMHLVAGAGAITVSLFALNVQVNFNPTPKYLKDVKFSTKTPKEVTSLFAQQEEDAESPVKIVEKVVEAVEEVIEVVKETLDVVKETIEKADKVVEEVKKIEDETKEIIQESKDIISEGTQLVEDVNKVIEEGREIVTEVAGVVKEVIVGSGEKEQAAEVNGSSILKIVKAEEVEEPKTGSVANMVAQIEKPVFEEDKKIEQEAVKEETNALSENDVTQATQVTQNEEVIKSEEEKELAKMATENKIAEKDVVNKPKNEVTEPQKELVEEVKIYTEIIKPVELVDETIVQSHETIIEDAFNTEPVAHTEGVLKKSDVKEEIKSEE